VCPYPRVRSSRLSRLSLVNALLMPLLLTLSGLSCDQSYSCPAPSFSFSILSPYISQRHPQRLLTTQINLLQWPGDDPGE